MSRRCIMNSRLNAFFLQRNMQRIAMLRSQRVEMIDVPCPRHLHGPFQGGARQRLVVLARDCATSLVPPFEMAQLDSQNRALEGLHPIVKSVQKVMILAVLPPIAQHASRSRILGIAVSDSAALAVRSQILAGIKIGR